MSHPWLEVIEKKGILERKAFRCTEIDILNFNDEPINVKYESQLRPKIQIGQAKDIIFKAENDSTITLTLFYGGPNNTLTFDKKSKKLIALKEE